LLNPAPLQHHHHAAAAAVGAAAAVASTGCGRAAARRPPPAAQRPSSRAPWRAGGYGARARRSASARRHTDRSCCPGS